MRHYAALKAAHAAEKARVKTPLEMDELAYRKNKKAAQLLLEQQRVAEEQRQILLATAVSAESRREAQAACEKRALEAEREKSRLANELRDRVLAVALDRRRSEQQLKQQQMRARMASLDNTPIRSLSDVCRDSVGGERSYALFVLAARALVALLPSSSEAAFVPRQFTAGPQQMRAARRALEEAGLDEQTLSSFGTHRGAGGKVAAALRCAFGMRCHALDTPKGSFQFVRPVNSTDA